MAISLLEIVIMNVRLRFILSLIFSGVISIIQAQSIKLSGKVVNEKNEPLNAVTVKIAGTKAGVATTS